MILKFISRLSILILTSPYWLHQVLSNSTDAAAFQANSNSTSTTPKQMSYFYQDSQGPGTYEFGYHIEDKRTKNIQFRNETKYSNGSVIGAYGFLRADGKFTIVNYVADQNGYRTKKKKNINVDHSLVYSTESQSTTTTTTEIPPLNITSGTLPSVLVDKVMDEFQIDLSPDASPADILHPNISDIINGNVPLTKNDKNNSQLDLQVVQNFIPSNFPIVPFQLPSDSLSKPNKSVKD